MTLHFLYVAKNVVVEKILGAGIGRSGGQRVAAEGRAVISGDQGLAVLLRQECADRHAVAKPFGQRHNVRLHTVFLVAKEAAQAAHAGLDFVQNQQDALAVAPLANSLQVVVVRDNHAGLTLHRLHHHRRRALGCCVHDAFNIVEVHVNETGQ